MKKYLLFLMLCWLVAISANAQISWRTYVDKNYGYSIPMPASLQLMPWTGDPASPWQNRSKTFQSADGNVSLSVSTHWTNGRTIQNFFKDAVNQRSDEGALINYSILKDNWCVVSGVNALGFEFYTKYVVFGDRNAGAARYITFTFAYPTSQRNIYDPAVTKINRKFIPALPGNYDRE